MEDFLNNIEKTRNTQQQLDFYENLNRLIEGSESSQLSKMSVFPVYSPRQIITSFIEKYEIFKLILEVPGNIIECGVAGGFGLMTFAHLSSIFEPYHYVRKIIGFDTFSGFQGISDMDNSSKADHMKEGGLNFGSYELLLKAIQLYDQNRVLGHINKVELVKGDLCYTFPEYIKNNPSLVISLLYMDVDLYRPTIETLKLAISRIPKGGVIAFDELNHGDYPGETIAVLESIGIENLRLKRMNISSMLSYAIVE